MKYQAMIPLSIYSGMREGELNALTWPDIDFEDSTVNIDNEVMDLLKVYRK